MVEGKLRRLGDEIVYAIASGDESVSVKLCGPHAGYSVSVSGSRSGADGPWHAQGIHIPQDEGGYATQPSGAFAVSISNSTAYFSADTKHPLPLTHLRVRIQQWSGHANSVLTATLLGVSTTARPAADTGDGRDHAGSRGKVIAVPLRRSRGSGHTDPANVGGGYDQLAVGFNLAEIPSGQGGVEVFWRVETEGVDGVWYAVWESPLVENVGQCYVSIGAALRCDQMFGSRIRLAWRVPCGGEIAFSASAVARASKS